MNPWVVKHDGVCSRCGASLFRGTPAVWARATNSMGVEFGQGYLFGRPEAIDAGVAAGP